MRIPGLKHLKQSARWLRSRLTKGALILGYHRIVETSQDPYRISVTPQHFAEQLKILRQYAHPMPLMDLVQALQDGNLPPRAVAITIDDGYADNLYKAKPLLEHYQVPATIFVTTGFMGREFWWDELERIFLSTRLLPDRLYLPLGSHIYEWLLNAADRELPFTWMECLEYKVNAAPQGFAADGDASTIQEKEEHSSRQQLLLRLHKLLLSWSHAERQKAMLRLWNWAGAKSSEGPIHRALTHDELIELTGGGLIDVGAHTMTHPTLSELSVTAQRLEIQQSKAYLEALLRRPVTSLSYPNGSLSEDTLAIVQDSGFTCACASYNDVARRGNNPLHLPRFWIPNWDGMTFSRWLQRWLVSN